MVSQALPLQREGHPHAATRAVFGGLLPEEGVREVVSRNLGVSPTNDYGLLEELGGDVAGALTLLEPGAKPAAEPASRRLSETELDALVERLPQRPLAADPEGGIRMSLAGAQPKLPVILHDDGSMALPTSPAAPTTHIIKPEPDRFPGVVDNEAFCMDLARACGLQVAAVSRSATLSGRPYLLVERYDRDLTVDPIRRLHQEDVCQALGRSYTTKYQQEGGPSVREVTDLLRRSTSIPAQELPRLLRAVAFNWMIGNCDAHGKNFSLLYDRGAPTLAPLYDLVSTVAYDELTTRMAMSIGPARMLGEVDDDAWDELAGDISFRKPTMLRLRRALLAAAQEQAQRLVTAGHDSAIARAIAARIDGLAGPRLS